MIRNTSGILCTEQYNKNTITTLATRQSGKPSIWCSNENNYPSSNIILLKWSSNNNFQNKKSYLKYNIGLMIGDYVNSNLKNEARTLQNIYETNVGIKYHSFLFVHIIKKSQCLFDSLFVIISGCSS